MTNAWYNNSDMDFARLFAIMLILRIPITFALAASSIFTAMYLKIPLMVIIQQMVQGVNSFSLMAIPFLLLQARLWEREGFLSA